MARPDDAVAFVVPVYNKARWLPRVLDRIAAQRGSFSREYIFVDDGSTDGSLSVLKRHTARWRNVTIIEQANHGPAHATNRGIERATAPFIKLCDADDLLADDATAVLLDAMRRDERPVLAYGGGEDFDDAADIVLNAPLADAPLAVTRKPLKSAFKSNPFRPAQVLCAPLRPETAAVATSAFPSLRTTPWRSGWRGMGPSSVLAPRSRSFRAMCPAA